MAFSHEMGKIIIRFWMWRRKKGDTFYIFNEDFPRNQKKKKQQRQMHPYPPNEHEWFIILQITTL